MSFLCLLNLDSVNQSLFTFGTTAPFSPASLFGSPAFAGPVWLVWLFDPEGFEVLGVSENPGYCWLRGQVLGWKGLE